MQDIVAQLCVFVALWRVSCADTFDTLRWNPTHPQRRSECECLLLSATRFEFPGDREEIHSLSLARSAAQLDSTDRVVHVGLQCATTYYCSDRDPRTSHPKPLSLLTSLLSSLRCLLFSLICCPLRCQAARSDLAADTAQLRQVGWGSCAVVETLLLRQKLPALAHVYTIV